MKTRKNKVASAPSVAMLALVASAADAGYAFGNSRHDARIALVTARNTLDASSLIDWIVRFKAGRIVSYFENPPKAQATACKNYVARRWDNLPYAERVDAAIEMIGKPAPNTERPNRRIETEHKACRAADTCVSELKRDAGLTKSNPKKRTARPATGTPEGASVTVAAPKVSNDNEAIEYVGNVMAALVTFCEKNNQTGSPKSVKQVVFRIESILIDAKRAIDKALSSGK